MAREQDYFALYRTTVRLLERLAGRRFSSLDLPAARPADHAPPPAFHRTCGRERISAHSPTTRARVRTRARRDSDRRLLRVPGWLGGRRLRRLPRTVRRPRALHTTGVRSDASTGWAVVDADVCIVGAGAAGGVLALELARRGIQVIVLESGPRHDLAPAREYVRRYLRHQNPWRTPLRELDRHTIGGPEPYRLEGKRARGVGGSTLHWEGYALRLHASDFRLRSLYGIADDWPISYQDSSPTTGGRAGARRRRRTTTTRGPRPAARRSRSPRSRSATPTASSPRRAGSRDRASSPAASAELTGVRGPLACQRLRDLPRLPHRGEGQHRSHSHPGRGGNGTRACRHRRNRPAARARSLRRRGRRRLREA